jgi:hypothetical protein
MKYILIACLAAMASISTYAQDIPSPNQTPPPPALLIFPGDPAVATRGTVRFIVYAADSADLNVTWSLTGDGNINAATGEYTAPDSVPDNPPKITVTSKIGHSASVSVVINSASCPSPASSAKDCVTLTPLTTMIRANHPDQKDQQIKLSAKALNRSGNLSDPSLNWEVDVDQKRDANGGRIEGAGESVIYIAPPAVPNGKVEVKAVAAANPKVSATAELIVVARYVSAHCVAGETDLESDPETDPGSNPPRHLKKCVVTNFNRLDGPTGSFATHPTKDKDQRSADLNANGGPSEQKLVGHKIRTRPVDDSTDSALVAAVNSSKALTTGSVLEVPFVNGVTAANCKNYDWKIVTQTEESPNILVYNPSDIGAGICTGAKFVIALPVRVLWADITCFPQQPDPQRTAPADFASLKDCWGQNIAQTMAPCDRHVGIMRSIYASNWVYTHFGQAGSAQGAISLSPVIGTGQRQLSFDVQADPAYKLGRGWLNIPLIFEKSTSDGSNLDALIVGLAYDIRAQKEPNFYRSSHFVLRKPQFQVRSSVEIAPTTPHDKNVVEAGTVKLPLVFNFNKQPSAFTAYPVIGIEGGSHFDTHLVEDQRILRGVAGVDGSFRWPFNLTHNFLGSSPITFEYSYRMRWLAYEEPFTDLANGGTEMLVGGRRSFLRGSFIEPLTPNLQFQVTLLRGSLPPDFRFLGNTVVIGLTFANPGSSEH